MLVDRKNWGNAAAFISVDEKTKAVIVYVKFYDANGCRSPGPSTDVLTTLPEELLAEVVGRGGWKAPMSAKLRRFCNEVWVKAKEANPKFKYKL